MSTVRQPDSEARPLDRRAFLRSLAWAAPWMAARPWSALGREGPVEASSVVHRLASRVEFLDRSAWTRIEPHANQLQPVAQYTRLTVHHAGAHRSVHVAAADVAAEIENILGAHQKRYFGDIGYHFIIDRAGRVWEGRSMDYMGAHVSGENEENIGVMLLGNFEYQRPSTRQLEALRETVSVLRSQFTIGVDRLYGHRDLGSTLCPGRYLYGHVSEMKSSA